MTLQLRPTPDEERWLAVGHDLGDALPDAALADRTGGWRTTGPLARVALFVLGVLAAGLFAGLLGFGGGPSTLFVAGVVAIGAAEWLAIAKRFHASGIEEGLCLAGSLMLGAWLVSTAFGNSFGYGGGSIGTLVMIAAGGLAGLRLLNPLVTTGAALALVDWLGATALGRMIDPVLGAGATSFLLAFAVAMGALAFGGRELRRPSHDRMLDWLVASLPVAAYARFAPWGYLDFAGLDAYAGLHRILVFAVLTIAGATLLLAGLRRRRHAPLLGFLGCVAGLVVEVQLATRVLLEYWLVACGVVALLSAALLDRMLRHERNGLTSLPPRRRDSPLDLLQTAAASVLARHSAPEPVVEEATSAGGGGRFGGGGASGSY